MNVLSASIIEKPCSFQEGNYLAIKVVTDKVSYTGDNVEIVLQCSDFHYSTNEEMSILYESIVDMISIR